MSANPRQLCVKALAEWQRGKLFADEILDGLTERNSIPTRDRAWLREAFYGTVRHLSEIDFLIGRLRDGEVDAETRAILRLGLYQLFHMRAPSHAVVNETVELAGISFDVTPVPGHSPASVAYGVDGHLFVGDVLFAGSVGRTDLAGGDMQTLLRSIDRLIRAYPPETIVLPGHGPVTTLGAEHGSNPFLGPLRA